MAGGRILNAGPWNGPWRQSFPVVIARPYTDIAYLSPLLSPRAPALPADRLDTVLPPLWTYAVPTVWPAWAIGRVVERIPHGLPEQQEDKTASNKPTWTELETADEEAEFEEHKERLRTVLDEEATRRIAVAYHPGAAERPEKEWQVRMSGKDLTAPDAERKRLIARCHGVGGPAAVHDSQDAPALRPD